MNYTSRMAALLGELRRERNGAVADAMRFYGKSFGLNYGVSLPTLRRIAGAETPDPDFAAYLYLQEVRELRLVGLHIACPEMIAPADFSFWASGIINSEVAEEAAFALLSRIEPLPELFENWVTSENPLLQYAALMAVSRSGRISPEWIEPALEVVRHHALACEQEAALVPTSASAPTSGAVPSSAPASSSMSAPTSAPSPSPVPTSSSSPAPAFSSLTGCKCRHSPLVPASASPSSSACALTPSSAARLTARGAVALLAAFGAINEENRQTVIRAVGFPGSLPATNYVREELAWRLNI